MYTLYISTYIYIYIYKIYIYIYIHMYQSTNDFVTFLLSLIASQPLSFFFLFCHFHLLFFLWTRSSRGYTCRDAARGRKHGQMNLPRKQPWVRREKKYGISLRTFFFFSFFFPRLVHHFSLLPRSNRSEVIEKRRSDRILPKEKTRPKERKKKKKKEKDKKKSLDNQRKIACRPFIRHLYICIYVSEDIYTYM